MFTYELHMCTDLITMKNGPYNILHSRRAEYTIYSINSSQWRYFTAWNIRVNDSRVTAHSRPGNGNRIILDEKVNAQHEIHSTRNIKRVIVGNKYAANYRWNDIQFSFPITSILSLHVSEWNSRNIRVDKEPSFAER